MEITNIRIRKIDREGRLKAYVTVTLDDSLAVHNIRIVEGSSGDRVLAMPSRKTEAKDGSVEYRDVVHPINAQFRAVLQEAILQEYDSLED